MKFRREELPGIVGKTVRYVQQVQGIDTNFAVVVSTLGVRFDGMSEPIKTVEQLDDFALLISKAWRDYLRLIPEVDPLQKELPNEPEAV